MISKTRLYIVNEKKSIDQNEMLKGIDRIAEDGRSICEQNTDDTHTHTHIQPKQNTNWTQIQAKKEQTHREKRKVEEKKKNTQLQVG